MADSIIPVIATLKHTDLAKPFLSDFRHLNLSTPQPKVKSPAIGCSLLTKLSRELRDLIYEEVLYDPNGLKHDTKSKKLHSQTLSISLLLTCKQIYAEARDVVYKINRPTFGYYHINKREPQPSLQVQKYLQEPSNLCTLALAPVFEVKFGVLSLVALWPYQESKLEQHAEEYVLGEIGRISSLWRKFHPAKSHPKARMELQIYTNAGFLSFTGNALPWALKTLSWAGVFSPTFIPSLVIREYKATLDDYINAGWLEEAGQAIRSIRSEYCGITESSQREDGAVRYEIRQPAP